MPIPFKLEHVIEKLLSGQPQSRHRVLRRLAGVRLSRAEAYRTWPHILEHKWFLSERLGRDVGMRVAAIDYFENIKPPRRPVTIRSGRAGLPPRLPMMLPFGERINS